MLVSVPCLLGGGEGGVLTQLTMLRDDQCSGVNSASA